MGGQFDERYVATLSADNCPLFSDIKPSLLTLPSSSPDGVKIAALTNACVAYAEKVLLAHGISSTFGAIEGADSVPASKPSPLGLLQICERLGVEPAETLMVGDAVGDGKAGVSAGCRSLGVSWGSYTAETLEESR